MKKSIIILLTLLLIISSSLIFADEIESFIIEPPQEIIQPCSVGGTHEMKPLNFGTIVTSPGTPQNPLDQDVIMTGNLYTCNHCNLTIICEHQPEMGASNLGNSAIATPATNVSVGHVLSVVVGHPDHSLYPDCTYQKNYTVIGNFDAQSGWNWLMTGQ